MALTPFGQVDGGRSRWREGAGLGLPIAKRARRAARRRPAHPLPERHRHRGDRHVASPSSPCRHRNARRRHGTWDCDRARNVNKPDPTSSMTMLSTAQDRAAADSSIGRIVRSRDRRRSSCSTAPRPGPSAPRRPPRNGHAACASRRRDTCARHRFGAERSGSLATRRREPRSGSRNSASSASYGATVGGASSIFQPRRHRLPVARRPRARRLAEPNSRRLSAATPERSVRVGSIRQDNSIPAMVRVDELLGKHFAILGTTGTGKSCTTALILRSIVAKEPGRAHRLARSAQRICDGILRLGRGHLARATCSSLSGC